jgi:hypothetical protein
MLALYQQAAATCPGLPWTILAAIGTVESDNGQSTLPGVHSGSNSAGAEGPMRPPRAQLGLGLSHSGGTLRRAAVLTSSHFPHTRMAGY